ncbi:hypothetical protein [Demequina sp. NBRC 110056]|uniref:hypothetical protein n=1 Tax=Demequina sp. NBRC 110056 TaxID=1570345 RepID=UPI000A044E1D|nr:hypothetical protein [Demequina sp. NBRC 110056]
MRATARPAVSVLLGLALVTGLTACDQLPDIDPSRLPDITRTTDGPDPEPTDTSDPQPTETETTDPEPVPTETVTEEPEPEPVPTETVTAEPSPTPTASADADASDDEGTSWWPWLLLAIPVLGLLIWWWAVAAKRRGWDKRLGAGAAELSWFEDSLVPQVLSKPTAAEAAAMWQAAKPRIIDLDRTLHELEETAPSEARSGRAAHGLSATRALAGALDDETSTQPGATSDELRARRAAIDAARVQARNWVTLVRK